MGPVLSENRIRSDSTVSFLTCSTPEPDQKVSDLVYVGRTRIPTQSDVGFDRFRQDSQVGLLDLGYLICHCPSDSNNVSRQLSSSSFFSFIPIGV